MPGCGIHLIIAARVLDSSANSMDRVTRLAFLFGAVAPDMGYFPGGDKFTSDLAHYVRSGQLTRALVRSAGDAPAMAFARGWAIHVLADILIHPLVNRAAGELINDQTRKTLTFADDPVSHIRVEQGLDASVAAEFGAPSMWLTGNHSYLGPVARVLDDAYRETYGFSPGQRVLQASSRACVRGVPLLLRYGQAASRWFAGNRTSSLGICAGFLFPTARLLTGCFPRSPLHAFARPVRPPDWLVREVLQVIDSFPTQFTALASQRVGRFRGL